MCGEKRKERRSEGGQTEFRCCPEDFRGMFQGMSACSPGRKDLPDFEEIVARMRAVCCGPEETGGKRQPP